MSVLRYLRISSFTCTFESGTILIISYIIEKLIQEEGAYKVKNICCVKPTHCYIEASCFPFQRCLFNAKILKFLYFGYNECISW